MRRKQRESLFEKGRLFDIVALRVRTYSGMALILGSRPCSLINNVCQRHLRWLDTVFQGQYLPSLSINYVAINKVLEKLPPQLYKIKMKICYDQGCNDMGVVMATK